jgi:hypothetical protein
MNPDKNTSKSFSIFDPAIRFEHREFYERIVSELNGILPVCKQGESTAVEISESATEQEQITELMKRVENFSDELLDVTKKLFDQYYVAKEALHQSILSTTAYNKINTLDRNLLERTCDVRWWALETAFSDCIMYYESTQKVAIEIVIILQELLSHQGTTTNQPDVSPLDTVINNETIGELLNFGTPEDTGIPYFIKKLTHFPTLLQQGNLDLFHNQFENFIKNAGGSGKDAQKKKCSEFITMLETLSKKIQFSCDRLEDINNSYTLYRDIIICDKDGYIIANSNKQQRNKLLGKNVSPENWFQLSLKTKNGTEYYAQDLSNSVVENQRSLVYTTAVRAESNENGAVVGSMGVFFDFQGEAKIILEEYMPRHEDGIIHEGCYSMFTNISGEIIASTDESILGVGTIAHIPRKNRNLQDGGIANSYLIFEGIDSSIFSARTDGYLDYKGLGWSSHVIIPKSHIFDTAISSDNLEISAEELMNSKIIPDINKQTYQKVQDDKESIQLISLNGIVFASKLGKRGGALGPIFNQITKTGDFVTSKMEDLLKEMARGELDLNLKALENFSKQAIDLVDRNLFERSADIRWWATDEYFWHALQNPSEENFRKASERFKVINGSYTMYRNLILADATGEIKACSRTELKNELMKINVSDQQWFQMGMRTSASSEFAVQDVMKSVLEKHKDRSLIYSGGVRNDGSRIGETIGVLGICFDWDTEAKKILKTCLPKDRNGEIIDGSAAFYTNLSGEIIETTDANRFPVGKVLDLPKQIVLTKAGETISTLIQYDNEKYIAGSSKTKGYREYEGLGWTAHVLRPLS